MQTEKVHAIQGSKKTEFNHPPEEVRCQHSDLKDQKTLVRILSVTEQMMDVLTQLTANINEECTVDNIHNASFETIHARHNSTCISPAKKDEKNQDEEGRTSFDDTQRILNSLDSVSLHLNETLDRKIVGPFNTITNYVDKYFETWRYFWRNEYITDVTHGILAKHFEIRAMLVQSSEFNEPTISSNNTMSWKTLERLCSQRLQMIVEEETKILELGRRLKQCTKYNDTEDA